MKVVGVNSTEFDNRLCALARAATRFQNHNNAQPLISFALEHLRDRQSKLILSSGARGVLTFQRGNYREKLFEKLINFAARRRSRSRPAADNTSANRTTNPGYRCEISLVTIVTGSDVSGSRPIRSLLFDDRRSAHFARYTPLRPADVKPVKREIKVF